MDVGETRSNHSHPAHFIMGLFVLALCYGGVLVAVRMFVMG